MVLLCLLILKDGRRKLKIGEPIMNEYSIISPVVKPYTCLNCIFHSTLMKYNYSSCLLLNNNVFPVKIVSTKFCGTSLVHTLTNQIVKPEEIVNHWRNQC